MGDPGVDCAAVALVGLMDGADDPGMPALQTVGDLRRPVRGAVIDDEDLHLVSAHQQGADAVFHIGF